jgi:hypothetical protein
VPKLSDPQSLNRYSYVLNNPIRYTDPTGHAYDAGGATSCWTPGTVGCGSSTPEADAWAANTIGNVAAVTPVLETGDDLLTLTTGCGYACQLGGEEPVGWGWRAVSGVALFLPGVGGAWIRQLRHADELTDAALMAMKRPVVIGETMERVNTYAQKIGAESIDDWLNGRIWTPELNDEFIEAMKLQNREVLDIGPDFNRRLRHRIDPTDPTGRTPSSIYGDERRRLSGYNNYRRLYGRFGQYQGGIFGLDY